MTYSTLQSKTPQLCIAIIIAILTTGFLRLQLFSGVPEADGGFYTFHNQYIHYALTNGQDLKNMVLNIYALITAWVYEFEVNQYILLRLIDGLIAVAASIVFFKVILKESGSTLFTVILATALFIIMNDIEVIAYGYLNSIWAAYLPLFSALLIWQNTSKEDKYSFYLIGGLVSLGVLLREPFLPFFLFTGLAILIGYGWQMLMKYLIGSALLGFTVLGFIMMLRDWDFIDLVSSYMKYSQTIETVGFKFPLTIIKSNWFIFFTATASIFYLVKLRCTDKKAVNIYRAFFWVSIALLPIPEYYLKLGMAYHFNNCLPGLAGLTALAWKYMSNQESEKIHASVMMGLGLISLFIILPTIDRTLLKSSNVYSPTDAIKWVKSPGSFRGIQMVERSQYLKVAAKVYGLSREDSTLAVSGYWQPLYPLTELLPPTYVLSSLRAMNLEHNFDENKIIEFITKYQPTIIVSSKNLWRGEESIPGLIEKTNLYEKVDSLDGTPRKIGDRAQDRSGFLSAIIYRLKDFK